MDDCVVDVTVEFLGVAFHNILYYASVYPKNVFVTKKKYNTVVYYCIHYEVVQYVDMCLKTIKESIKSNNLLRIEFAVTDHLHEPVVKFIFDFQRLANYDETSDAYLVGLEQNLRAYCLQLATISNKCKALPEDCSFTIFMYTAEAAAIALANNPVLANFPLVEVDERAQDIYNVMPLRRFPFRNYNIDTFIELHKNWSFHS